jgi:hypothetical protein
MQSQTFITHRGRPIKIAIDEHISFRFPNEGDREFYWIEIDDWKQDETFWINHMVMKNWYSPAMTEFIKQATNGNRKESA